MRALKQYKTLTLFGANVALALVAFFLYDPFQWFRGGYDSSPELLSLLQADVSKIEILPDGKRVSATLNRGREIAKMQKQESGDDAMDREGEKKGDASSLFGKLFHKKKFTYEWALSVADRPSLEGTALTGKTPAVPAGLQAGVDRIQGAVPGRGGGTYPGDTKRIVQFFNDLEKSRRYYSMEASDANLETYGMKSGSDGSCECLAIRLYTNGGGRVHTLYVGHSSIRSGESYVRLDDEKKIYQVRSNLSGAVGADDPFYFRNRSMASGSIPLDSITGIEAHFATPGRDVQLSKGGTGWQMITPVPGPVKAGEVSSLLEEIHGWRIRSFPDAIPADLDRKMSFRLEVVYSKNLTEPGTIRYDVLGKRGYDSYILRDEAGVLVEVNSYYLDSLLDPVAKLAAERSPSAKRGMP